MRILDKYLLKEFLLPLLYCFDAFVMLFIVHDLLDNLSDFLQYRAPVGQVARYYVILLPEAFTLILPMSLLLATLFCLSNLGKHNELIAMRASGVSMARLAVPLLAVGAAGTLAVLVLSQSLLPRSKERADAFLVELRGRGAKHLLENFFYVNATERRDWYARRFDTRTRRLENIELHQRTPDNKPLFDVFAESATWTNGMWVFSQGYVVGQGPRRDFAQTNFPSLTETPRRLLLEARRPSQMSTTELRRQIAVLRESQQRTRIADYQVELHTRWAFPLTCLIVVWLGVPLGTTISRRGGAMMGVASALALVVAFYFLSNITLALGKGERVPPVIAAWLTNAIFAAVGAVLFVRAR